MSRYRFTVNIPNPTAKAASVQLRLEPAKSEHLSLASGERRRSAMVVKQAGISLDPCAERGERTLELRLRPFESVDVHAIFVGEPAKKPAVAGFHLVDRRNGKRAGGVMLACFDPPAAEPPGHVVPIRNGCPATLARNPYLIRSGDDPKRPLNQPVKPSDALDLVAAIINPTGKALQGVQVYLEYLRASFVEFTPAAWNAGTLAKGDVFYATWPFRLGMSYSGALETSIVVGSEGTNPVRLDGRVAISGKETD